MTVRLWSLSTKLETRNHRFVAKAHHESAKSHIEFAIKLLLKIPPHLKLDGVLFWLTVYNIFSVFYSKNRETTEPKFLIVWNTSGQATASNPTLNWRRRSTSMARMSIISSPSSRWVVGNGALVPMEINVRWIGYNQTCGKLQTVKHRNMPFFLPGITPSPDLIFCYKILCRLTDIQAGDFFELAPLASTRGHSYKFVMAIIQGHWF